VQYKFTAEKQAALLDLLRVGVHPRTACDDSQVPYGTFKRWLKLGKTIDESEQDHTKRDYLRFYEAAKKALADAQIRHIENINKASAKNWLASAWLLERRYPKQWGKQTTNNLTSPAGKPVKIEQSGSVIFIPERIPDYDEKESEIVKLPPDGF
jgi:hypothetical protein